MFFARLRKVQEITGAMQPRWNECADPFVYDC